MKFLRASLFSLLFSNFLHAQFLIGWDAGYATPHELNREIYEYNVINHSGLTKEMKEVHWNQGPTIGVRKGSDVYFEFKYSRKKALVGSEFDSASVPMKRQMKVYSNTYDFGVGTTVGNWSFGLSMDCGRFKGFGRRGTADGIKDVSWQRLWVLDKTRLLGIAVARLYIAETVYIERSFSFVKLRFYAQLFGIKEDLDGLDSWMFGTDLNYAMPARERFTNYGVSVLFCLGGK